MKIAVLKETQEGERRVAATPETVKKLIESGFEVLVQNEAGIPASIRDSDYEKAGAVMEEKAESLYQKAGIYLKVQKPLSGEMKSFKEGAVLIAFLHPLASPDLIRELAAKKITAFAMEMIPRIARAQKMDALSSQSNIAGYKAVMLAANASGKLFPLLMTAAGTIQPARVLVLGAGVAGLQAIATAKRLGARVEAFDTRPVVKEQVESLGARFISLEIQEKETEDKGGYAKELSEESHKQEIALIAQRAAEADIVITTALIPGKPAPLLLSEGTVKQMKSGSVIVDLAAEAGGNCELTEAGKEVEKSGVKIIGLTNLPSLMAEEASRLYARNVMGFLFEISKKGVLELDRDNEIVKGTLVTEKGEVVHPAVQKLMRASRSS